MTILFKPRSSPTCLFTTGSGLISSSIMVSKNCTILPVRLPPQQGLLCAESLLKPRFPGEFALGVGPDDLHHREDCSPVLAVPAICRPHVLVNQLLFIGDDPEVERKGSLDQTWIG